MTEAEKTAMNAEELTDNDIACLEAFSKTKWASHLEFNDGWNAAIAHAEAEHAEQVKVLVAAAQNIVNTLERCEELRTIFLAKTPRSNLWQEVEQVVGAKNIIKEALAVHRGQNE